MPVVIREANNSDIPAVVGVIRSVFDEYAFTWEEDGYHADLYDIEGHYWAEGDAFYVAERDGEVVGTVALALFDTLEGPLGELTEIDGFLRIQGCDCSLERLYVHASARKGGIGQALTAHAVESARAQGRKAMELWSDKRFTDAHRLYGRFGAKVVGDRICHDPDQSPEWGLFIAL